MKLKNFDANKILSSSLALWMISIVTAVLMWIYVTGMEEAEYITRKFTCPLEYRGLDTQTILRERLFEVDVEVRGPEEAMTRLDYSAVKAYVDARNLAPGKKYTVNINVETPSNITFVSCFPSQAVLNIARQVTRLMNVQIVLPENIPEGQYIEGVNIIPKEVGVRGAEDDVLKIGAVRITPTIEELQKGQELLMPVKFAQSEAFEGNVTIEPAQVRFSGILARGLPKKRVPVNVRLTGKLDADYEVQSIITDPSEVQIEGQREDLAKIDAVDTEVIDISLMASDQSIVAPLRQPEVAGVKLANNTTSVQVRMQLREARAEKMLTNIPVELRNADNNTQWSCSPAVVSVAVEGKPSMIAQFSAEDLHLKAFVDMTNIFMAPVTLPVKTEIISSDSFRVNMIEPQNITVNASGMRSE